MIALVLSGGGSRGALQAGAILALLDRGIMPDLIVGTSVGALNGAALAAQPEVEHAYCMAARWRTVTRSDIFPGNPAMVAWRLLSRQPSLYPNTGLRRFILTLIPPEIRRFADLQITLLVTATELHTGQLWLFGEDPQERLIDALMASAAIPPYLPPWRYRDKYYVDGGVLAHLPLSIALERGATTIYALEIGHQLSSLAGAPTLRYTVSRSIYSMLHHQALREWELARREGVEIHHIPLLHYGGLPAEEFSHGDVLLELGYATAQTYLETGTFPEVVPFLDRPTTSDRYRVLAQRLHRTIGYHRRPALRLRPPPIGRLLGSPRSRRSGRRTL